MSRILQHFKQNFYLIFQLQTAGTILFTNLAFRLIWLPICDPLAMDFLSVMAVTVSTASVSYTHLDVYKRQVLLVLFSLQIVGNSDVYRSFLITVHILGFDITCILLLVYYYFGMALL